MSRPKSSVIVRPFGTERQAIVSMGDTHIIIGSPAIHDTVSQVLRPHELLLAALAIDCVYTCMDTVQEKGWEASNVTVSGHWIEPNIVALKFITSGLDTNVLPELLDFITQNSALYKLLAPTVSIQMHING
jgi:hypothetical protein